MQQTDFYDPLRQRHPSPDSGYVQSYWTRQLQVPQLPVVTQDIHTDVAIIGAGLTGLSCALALRQRGINVCVLDAVNPAWGCSGRNAGFVLPGTGRLSLAQMITKWGEDQAQAIYAEFKAGIEITEQHITRYGIECDLQRGGYLKIAHKPSMLKSLEAQARLLNSRFSDPAELLSPDDVQIHYLATQKSAGGLYFPYSFGLNPLKLSMGLANAAQQSGAALYAHSPVQAWQQLGQQHKLHTPTGSVTADKVILATNAYTGTHNHALVEQRHFPVLSSVIVTEPLNETQLAACRFKSGLLAMDTRALKYYYRLLPDNRILFGGRGAITGRGATSGVFKQRLLQALKDQFCGLQDVRVADYWSGWISVSLDDYPRVWFDHTQGVGYAMGYCGSGVSFSQLAGRRLAQAVCEEPLPSLPFYQSPLKRFPLSPFKRMGLWGYYQWGRFQDRWL